MINQADTAFILLSAALVMLMTPGLALFYGGMVRRKNVLGTMMHSFLALAIVSLQWALWGYSLAFGPDHYGIVGGLQWAGLSGVGLDPSPDYASTVPHQAFMIYQGMFAVITPALIAGAFAERMKFSAFVLFLLLWCTLVYDPIAHWVWGKGGWLGGLGALDFAGGTVVHISSGVSALAAALLVGKRKGYGFEPMLPHHLPMTVLGAALLWFGWFGFNAGSALAVGRLSTGAFVATHLASAAAALGWMLVEWVRSGKPTILGLVSGAVAGLVAITPAAGFVGPVPAIIIGAAAGIVCYYFSVHVKMRLGYDDSLDVVGIHGAGGILGAIATGLFASTLVNPDGANGLFFGNPHLLSVQVVAVLVTSAYSFGATYLILKIVEGLTGLRADDTEQEKGLDESQHSESGYAFEPW
jgi:Amt family ammonium transporter